MKPELLFDFKINESNNTVVVVRDFDAVPEQVWLAWTTQELLEQWWAPKPYHVETIRMDFKVNGYWHYAMVSPKGERNYARFDYEEIIPMQSLQGKDAFCSEAGTIDTSFSRMQWNIHFSDTNSGTRVEINIEMGDKETLQKIMELGFKEGFTAGLNNLRELLFSLKHKS